MKNNIKNFSQFITERIDMDEFRGPLRMGRGRTDSTRREENPYPKTFIDSEGNPLHVGKSYDWIDSGMEVIGFDGGVVYFSNGIEMHVTDYINSVLGTEDEDYENAAGFPILV